MTFPRIESSLAKNDRVEIFLAAALFIILRSPILLAKGRLIAEEGTVCLPAWLDRVLLKSPRPGYATP